MTEITSVPAPNTPPTLADLQVGDTVTVHCNPAHFIFTDEDLAEADAEGRDLTLLSSTAIVKEMYSNGTVRVALHPKSISNIYRCSNGIETIDGHTMIAVKADSTATETAGRYTEQKVH